MPIIELIVLVSLTIAAIGMAAWLVVRERRRQAKLTERQKTEEWIENQW